LAVACRKISGCGLPAETGTTPVAFVTAATREPLPTAIPRSVGSVASRFVATKRAPALMAKAASVSSRHPRSGENPWTTAAGLSAALSASRKPRSRRAARRPAPPTGSTSEPCGSSAARMAAAACEEVMTSCASVGMPRLVSWSATVSGSRAALFVTNIIR
jgi:hypothetical protein